MRTVAYHRILCQRLGAYNIVHFSAGNDHPTGPKKIYGVTFNKYEVLRYRANIPGDVVRNTALDTPTHQPQHTTLNVAISDLVSARDHIKRRRRTKDVGEIPSPGTCTDSCPGRKKDHTMDSSGTLVLVSYQLWVICSIACREALTGHP